MDCRYKKMWDMLKIDSAYADHNTHNVMNTMEMSVWNSLGKKGTGAYREFLYQLEEK